MGEPLKSSCIYLCFLTMMVWGAVCAAGGECRDLPPDDIVIRSSLEPGYAEADAEALIDGSVEEVWAVLTDYERLSEYMPSVKDCRILGKTGSTVRLYYEIGYFVFTTSYTVELREWKDNHLQTWRLLEGPFSVNSGSWALTPHGDGRTKVAYHVRISHNRFPDRILLRLLTGQLPDVYQAIQDRIDRDNAPDE